MENGPDYLEQARLKNRGFVLLGAGGGGIGPAVARALAGAGAELLCVDISEAEARNTAVMVNGEGIAADIRDRREMEAVFARAKSLFGSRLSGVVDIVAVGMVAPLENCDDETLDWQFGIVFRHALLALQQAAPLLAENGGGTITLVGSRAGLRPLPNQAIYGSMKAALHHLVRSAAMELGPRNIRVNAVSPGFVFTPRVKKALSADDWKRVEATNPLRRMADPEDIAKSILFLSSDLASYVNGNILVLDGAGDNNVGALGLKLNLPTAIPRHLEAVKV
ncbi:NAD(P)-dependent dehydrogenase (short-subunit alcohol dehydrogenase family) [Bradyrhizobium diazoefficiens]|uniref:SDR family NAD(P)-dependent oxidoreductase n=1 Tax=Bradyrhizobium TaxID=374 RepID=UPI00148ECD1F|nr:SDR family oxidoreductase [Bradyrhizobium diazoefficiens]AWO93239.2 SDR family oxidoreductase [Bradyrhizobium diazoefficiens]